MPSYQLPGSQPQPPTIPTLPGAQPQPATWPSLPGGNYPDTPALPGSQQPPPSNTTLPAFWYDLQEVIARVLALASVDPVSASEIWREYKRMTGR